MSLACIPSKRHLNRLGLICILAASWAAFTAAQGLHQAPGTVARTIILPQKLVAGAPATLAVLDSAGRLVPNAVVELSSGQKVTTDVTGRALFITPGGAGKLLANLPGRPSTVAATITTDSVPQSSANGLSAGMRVSSYPRVVAIHDRFTLEGTGFRGAAESNHVFLADQPCLVIASSPVALIVLPSPRIPVGATTLHVSVAEHGTEEMPVSAVSLQFSGPTQAPEAGAQGEIILNVRGSTDPLGVEVRNGSPGIIQFPHGSVQRLMTSGGAQNSTPVELKFIASGNYTVTATLIPTTLASSPTK